MDTRPDPKQEINSNNNQLLEKMKAEMNAWKKTRGPVVHIPENNRRDRTRR